MPEVARKSSQALSRTGKLGKFLVVDMIAYGSTQFQQTSDGVEKSALGRAGQASQSSSVEEAGLSAGFLSSNSISPDWRGVPLCPKANQGFEINDRSMTL
jgi:hypothetical protein